MKKAKEVSTSLGQHLKLSASQAPSNEEDTEYMAKVPYANAVGSIMYAMLFSRPDIAHAVSLVSRFMANPGVDHWED